MVVAGQAANSIGDESACHARTGRFE